MNLTVELIDIKMLILWFWCFLKLLAAKEKGSGDFNFTMQEFEELRHNEDAYREFLEDYVSIVVGKIEFKKKSKCMKLSNFVTISDEAFALLTIKNNEEAWPAKVNNSLFGDGETTQEEPRTRYTNRRRLSGSPRDGWTREGMKQFLMYYKLVADDRKSAVGRKFEEDYLEECRKDQGRKTITLYHDDQAEDDESSDEVKIPTDWDEDINSVARTLLEMAEE